MRRHVISQSGELVSTITVGRGVVDEFVTAAVNSGCERVAVLTQPATVGIGASMSERLNSSGLAVTAHTLPDGEAAKQMSVVERVYRVLNDATFTRDDLIVGVGGGSLTDVAGFVAGTYLRGLSAMYVSTTLLGAVDASIGGKTGVNVDGKNLAGVFAHPEAVFIDVDVMDRLPLVLKREGAAEALKTGFIEDMEIVAAYERDGLDVDLENVINRSVAVKAAVVTDDYRELSRRAILNYGHTVGHAIETTTSRSHAQSVAIGTVAAGAASRHHFGFTGEERQRNVLTFVGLPLMAPEAEAIAVREAMMKDKKRDASGHRMVLLEDFGKPQLVHADDATVQAAFDGISLV